MDKYTVIYEFVVLFDATFKWINEINYLMVSYFFTVLELIF